MNSFAFRGLLLDISNALTTEEVRDLKFACSDFIPAGKSEHIKRAHELFSELERMNLLGENNRDFLASIFVRINRADLRNKLLGIRETPRAPPLLGTTGPVETSLNTMIVKEPLIQDIAEDVSTSWKTVGRKLRVKEAVIDNIDDEYRRVTDKATKVLMKWKTTSGGGATVATLMNALKQAGRTDLAETVRDKVYRQGVSARPANEHQDTQYMPARPPNENLDTQNTVVVPPRQFPNMAELDPTRYMAQPRVDGPAPRVTQVEHEVPQRQPSEEQLEEHDAPLPVDQRPATEEPVREEAAATSNEQPNSVGPQAGTQMPVQVQDPKLGLHLGNFGNFLNPAKYAVVDRIGQGGYAKVYLCVDKETKREYAVKLVDLGDNDASTRKQAEALRKEIEILQQLENPFIVRYCHTEDEHNTLAVFMEYMRGGSVQKRLRDKGPMPQKLVRKCTWQILKGLQYLHDNGYIHRDIKGANVLLDENDNVKLADFGISKKMQDFVTCIGGLRTSEAVMASTYWTSPELLLNHPYHRNTDCWSVGCTVIEMLTGRHPLPDHSLPQAMYKIINQGITPPASCNSVAFGFLDKCLTKDPTKRPSAADLLQDPFPSLNPPED